MDLKVNEIIESHDKRRSIGRRGYDSSSVVRLVQARSNPHAGAIAEVRALLTSLEQGRLTTVVYIAIGQHDAVKGTAGIDDKCRHAIKGALLALANEV